METNIVHFIQIKEVVRNALRSKHPVVALESAVVTHGLPHPINYQTAFSMEEEVRMEQAIPATICAMDGFFRVGLEQDELERLALDNATIKISNRDLAGVITNRLSGGTTIAATMAIAQMAKITVFATGGIGGVHREGNFDISADLPMLANTPMLVVCSGVKSILDLPATREFLETYAIPVIGYQTEDMPAFFSPTSGLKVDYRLDHTEEIARFANVHWSLGLKSAVLVTVPPPREHSVELEVIESAIAEALRQSKKEKISGSAVTPYLLQKVKEITGDRSMAVNIDLLKNNARVAARIADSLSALAI